jgi:hypothetical protein
LLASGVLLFAACGGGGGDDDDGGQTIDPNGTHTTYVLDTVRVPSSPNDAQQIGLDIDGDGRPDNALGSLLASISSIGNIDIQASVDAQLATGGVILLADMQATSLTDATGVGLTLYLGDPATATPAPCTNPDDPSTCGQHLMGTGTFTVDASSPTDATVVGSNVGGTFTGGPGNLTLQLALSADAAPLTVPLIGARVQTGVAATALSSGRMGGAITVDDINMHILPAVEDLITTVLAACTGGDPNCGCPDGSSAATVMSTFDDNGDCMVTLEELKMNTIISATLGNPDLDLLDGSGNFNPNSDGVKESISLGVGFSAVAGTFTP